MIKRWLTLFFLLYLVAFSWDDDDNVPQEVRGYRLYLMRVTCTESIIDETIDVLDNTARRYEVVGCGIREGYFQAYATTLGVNNLESEPSNTVLFQFQ